MTRLALLERVLSVVPFGIAVLDTSTLRHLYANEPYRHLVCGGSDPTGRSMDELCPAIAPALLRAMHEASPQRDSPLEVDRRPLILTVVPLDEHDAQSPVAILVSEATAGGSTEECDRLFGAVAHELRNPLSAIQSALYVAQRSSPGSAQQTRALGTLGRSVATQVQVLDDAQDLSRFRRGLVSLTRSPCSVDHLVRDVVAQHHSDALESDVTVEVDCAPGLWVDGDKDRLRRSIAHLFGYALRFSPSSGHVRVRATSHDDAVQVEVENDGADLAADQLAHLFEPLARPATGVVAPEFGLGLVKAVVEAHGGRVAAERAALGTGIRLSFILPRASKPSSKSTPPESAPTVPRSGIRVLLVDDDRVQRLLLGRSLEAAGHIVTTAANALDALKMLQTAAPDIVMTDLHLPDMDGFELIGRIRANGAFDALPVIAVTGRSEPEMMQKVRSAGFTDYLVKPVALAALMRAMSASVQPGPKLAEK